MERYREQVEFDQQNLEKMNQRLSLISKLRKKYQLDSDSLVDALSQWQEKIMSYDNTDAEIARLKKKYQEDHRIYMNFANELHESRERLAAIFGERLVAELADMDMKEVQFRVDLDRFSGDATGTDIATFMISPNRGMPIRPLYDIASGGEMSRIMLAIKTILSGKGGIETLIFDEIDTGIGGLVLTTVADKLEELGLREQVICVTHAPSIAARADKNFYIKKYVENDMTETHVKELLSEEEIIAEVARMSGSQDEWQLEHAMRQRAQKKNHN